MLQATLMRINYDTEVLFESNIEFHIHFGHELILVFEFSIPGTMRVIANTPQLVALTAPIAL